MALAARLEISDFTAASAGTRAVIGHPIQHQAALVLENLGGEPSNFSARQLKPRTASDADLVLAMTRAHRDSVLELAPHKLNRTFTLTEAAVLASKYKARTIADLAVLRPQLALHESADIPDPIGRSAEVFAAIGTQISIHLSPVLELCRRSQVRKDG